MKNKENYLYELLKYIDNPKEKKREKKKESHHATLY